MAIPGRCGAPDYPWGRTEEEDERQLERSLLVYGPREPAKEMWRALHAGLIEEETLESLLDVLRLSASPGAVRALHRMNRDVDVRHVLPAVRVPTLIVHGTKDEVVPVEVAHHMASRIPMARVVEIPGGGQHFYGPGKQLKVVLDETERFLKDVWETGGWEESEPERVLATVLFTDIVDSTARATDWATAPGGSCSSATTH